MRGVSFVIAAALLGACGTSSTSSSSGPIAQVDLPTALADAYCPTVDPCCPGTNTGCKADMVAWTKQAFADPSAAKQVYNPDAARRCVDAIKALPKVDCSSMFAATVPALAACSAILDGTLAPGATCAEVSDCKQGAGNGTTAGGFTGCSEFDNAPPKRCREFKPTTTVGDACEMGFAGQSPTVLVCAGSLYCEAGKCAPAAKLGAACAGLKPCEPGLNCTAGTCVVAGKEGDLCASAGCAEPLTCIATKCAKFPAQPWIINVGFQSSSYACH